MRTVAARAKELRYAVELAAGGELRTEDGVVLAAPGEWSPEHLLLAALVGCSLKSFRHHASRREVEVRAASGGAWTLVTRRDKDGRYAMVETGVELAVELEPEPSDLAEFLDLAERDCFVGSSLTAEPRYRWIVNGRTIAS
jgi:organic hydroperoxide reductase OsmC/OhrA